MQNRRYVMGLTILLCLFTFRVTAQLIQFVFELPFLPSFHVWHSGALPYPALVASQFVIIGILIVITDRVRKDNFTSSPWKYRSCFVGGGAYFSIMAFRTFAGLTFFAGHPWFSKTLPALFHIVLACFLLLLGHYFYDKCKNPAHLRSTREANEIS